jgi:hypothetical protein
MNKYKSILSGLFAGKVSFLKGVDREKGVEAENILKTIKWP